MKKITRVKIIVGVVFVVAIVMLIVAIASEVNRRKDSNNLGNTPNSLISEDIQIEDGFRDVDGDVVDLYSVEGVVRDRVNLGEVRTSSGFVLGRELVRTSNQYLFVLKIHIEDESFPGVYSFVVTKDSYEGSTVGSTYDVEYGMSDDGRLSLISLQ